MGLLLALSMFIIQDNVPQQRHPLKSKAEGFQYIHFALFEFAYTPGLTRQQQHSPPSGFSCTLWQLSELQHFDSGN